MATFVRNMRYKVDDAEFRAHDARIRNHMEAVPAGMVRVEAHYRRVGSAASESGDKTVGAATRSAAAQDRQAIASRAVAAASRSVDAAVSTTATRLRDVDGKYIGASVSARVYGTTARSAVETANVAVATSSERVGLLARSWQIAQGVLAGFALTNIVGGLFNVNAGLESTRIAFTTMLGSAERADATLASLFKFAETTPFESEEVLGAARALIAFQVSAEDLEPTLRSIGDIAAGVNIPIGELAEVYGKARVQGRLFAEDINQLTGRGVPVITELAKIFGVAEGEVKNLVESGKVGFPQLQQVFANLTAEGAMFGGTMEDQSRSARGLISTLMDVATFSMRDVTGGAFESLKDDLAAVAARAAELSESGELKRWGQEAGEAVKGFYENVKVAIRFLAEWGPSVLRVVAVLAAYRAGLLLVTAATTAWAFVTSTAKNVMVAAQAVVILLQVAYFRLTGNLVAAGIAMQAFNGLALANPIGAVIGVLAAVVTALVLFRNATDDSAEAIRAENQALQEKLRLLREMSGAQLFREQSQRADRGAQLGTRVQGIDRRVAGLRNGTVNAPRQTIAGGAFTGEGRSGNVLETQEQANQREIDSLLQSRVGWTRQLVTLGREQEASDQRLEGSLEAQIGYLRAARALITDRREENITPGMRARADSLGERIGELEAEQRRNEGADAAPTPAAPAAGGRTRTPRDTSDADANRAAGIAFDGGELGAAEVSADRAKSDAQDLHAINMRMEALRQERALAESRTSVMEDGDAKSLRASFERFNFTQRELALRRELSQTEQEIAEDASKATRDAAVRDVNRGPAENRAQGRETAEAEHQARLTEIQNRGELEREGLDTEGQDNSLQAFQDGRARLAAHQERAYAEAQARTEDYWASDARIAADAAQVRINIENGLIKSQRDVAEARRALAEASDIAETDAERTAIAELTAALDLLGGSMDDVAAKAGANQVAMQLNAGLIRSQREVGAARQALQAAYADADTDEERARILALTHQVERLGGTMDDLAEKSAKGFTDHLVSGLKNAIEIGHELAGLFQALGNEGLSSLANDLANVAGAGMELGKGIATGDPVAIAQGSIKLATSVATLVKGINDRREAEVRATRALGMSAAATDRNTRALMSGQIGEDVTADQLALVGPAVEAALASLRRARQGNFGTTGWSEAQDEIGFQLQGLANAGLDVADFQQEFQNALQIGDLTTRREALEALLARLTARFGEMGGAMGTYSADVAGATAHLNDLQAQMGLEGQAAMRAFVAMLRETDIADFLAPLLTQLEGVDVATPAGQRAYEEALRAFYAQVDSGAVAMPGDMSRVELERLLATLRGLGTGETAGGQGDASFRSVSQVTVTQAAEITGYLQEGLRAARDGVAVAIESRDFLGALLAAVTGSGGALAPSLPAVSTTDGAAMVQVGPVQLTFNDRMTPEEIGRLAGQKIEAAVREPLTRSRGGRTNRS